MSNGGQETGSQLIPLGRFFESRRGPAGGGGSGHKGWTARRGWQKWGGCCSRQLFFFPPFVLLVFLFLGRCTACGWSRGRKL